MSDDLCVATTGIWIRPYMRGKLKVSRANVTVVIDGVKHKVPWGEQFLEVPPGDHSVSVYWARKPPKVDVHVREAEQVSVRFDAPRWTWQPGKLSADEM